MKKLICIFSLLILFTASLHAQEWNTLLAQLRRMEIQILRVHALADRYQNQQNDFTDRLHFDRFSFFQGEFVLSIKQIYLKICCQNIHVYI